VALHRIVLLALAACSDGGASDPDASADSGSFLLTIEPPVLELESVGGAQPSAAFRAFRSTRLGSMEPVSPDAWTIAHDRMGAIDPSGTFVANGRAGGEVEITARVGTTTATARATVRIVRSIPLDPSVPAAIPPLFDTLPEEEDPFEAASIVYPLEGARLPNNAGAPDVQWIAPSEIGDAFRITFESPFARVTGYAFHANTGFGSRFLVDRDSFRAVADSSRNESLSVRVDRLPASHESVVRGAPVSIWLSEDGIFGTLYYWQVATDPQASDVYRIDAATSARTSVFATEPGTCVGCHALSRDGRKLAATLDSRGPDWVTVIADATSSTRPPRELVTPLDPAFNFLAFSPDGARILASQPLSGDPDDTRLLLLGEDATPIAEDDLPSGAAGYPAWSPDGALVAWMEGGGDGPRGTDEGTRVVIADATEAGLDDPRTLHDGVTLQDSPEGGLTDSRPTFSPDSRWVVFAHGTRSVSAVDIAAERPRAGLYLVPVGGGPAVRLDRGMGRNGPVDAFWPVFSPFATEEADGGKLFWLAFYSRQDYGNERSGTRGTGRRQLWVMAIDPVIANGGTDPSHPPYWLSGQDVRADDIAAQWAATACRAQGEDCSASSECCSGVCGEGPDPVCEPPAVCRRYGESCESAADCCPGLECNLHVCGYEPPI
jgi:Tol biopolymer transport system component